ncbi:MAG: hypothetical protein WDO19_28505 [Bacteroidota bacterium]
MKRSFTQSDIINYLEETDHETYHFFIDFEHPYFYTAGSRLTLYADEKRWAIVFEKSGYSTGNSCGEIEFAYFGNCLKNLQSGIPGDITTSNIKQAILIHNTDLEQIDEGEFEELVAKGKNQISARDTYLTIEQDPSKYTGKGIMPRKYNNPKGLFDFYSLIRFLDEAHPNIFRATDQELRQCLPGDLPMLMQIDEWHHEAYTKYKHLTSPTEYQYKVIGKKPGDYETYNMIADILVSGDISKWKPTLEPNNNWRNWPNARHM